jgi:hypothetical protein
MSKKFTPNVTVTPSMARQWLDRNAENNRRPKKSRIPAMARDMATGKWNSDTGELIKFDVNGTLIDGQNRLHAVIMAGVPIRFDIMEGLPTSVMPVLDTGAPRSAGDVMTVAGATDRMRSAAIVRWSLMWDAKIYTGMGSALRPTHSEIIERYRSDSGAYNAAATRATDCQNRGLGVGAPAGVAFYLFYWIDRESAHAFFDQYVSGANLPEKSPVLALRNKMMRRRQDRLTRPEQLGYFIRAWNGWRLSKPMTHLLLVNESKLTDDNFPQPK